jgi:hypothetical protein
MVTLKSAESATGEELSPESLALFEALLQQINSTADSPELTAPPTQRPTAPANHIELALLAKHSIFPAGLEFPGWFECHLCSRAGQRKRFELGDTLQTHINGGQHQRELFRRTNSGQSIEAVYETPLPTEIQKINDNDYKCTVCLCGTISGRESAVAHVRGVKHIKAVRKSTRPAAPTVA